MKVQIDFCYTDAGDVKQHCYYYSVSNILYLVFVALREMSTNWCLCVCKIGNMYEILQLVFE